MFDKVNEALKNWKSLLPMLKPFVRSETQNAVRRKKMNVATAPNGTTIGVRDPADNNTINIPYQPACANVSANQSVWVEWLYDNFSTAIAVTPGDGLIPSPLPISQGGTGTTNGAIKNVVDITSLPTTDIGRKITPVEVSSAITVGNMTIPSWTHGFLIERNKDGVFIGVSSGGKLYTAYRNNLAWGKSAINSGFDNTRSVGNGNSITFNVANSTQAVIFSSGGGSASKAEWIINSTSGGVVTYSQVFNSGSSLTVSTGTNTFTVSNGTSVTVYFGILVINGSVY